MSRNERGRLRNRRFSFSRPLLSFLGLLIAYYAFPVELADSLWITIVSLLLVAGGIGLVVYLMTVELGQVRRGEKLVRLQTVALMLVFLVMAFSMAFFLLNEVDPYQFAGLETRTDSLYFVLSTMATVGFGDVHAQGQFARGMVSCLIVFNVVVVAALARESTGLLKSEPEPEDE